MSGDRWMPARCPSHPWRERCACQAADIGPVIPRSLFADGWARLSRRDEIPLAVLVPKGRFWNLFWQSSEFAAHVDLREQANSRRNIYHPRIKVINRIKHECQNMGIEAFGGRRVDKDTVELAAFVRFGVL